MAPQHRKAQKVVYIEIAHTKDMYGMNETGKVEITGVTENGVEDTLENGGGIITNCVLGGFSSAKVYGNNPRLTLTMQQLFADCK